MKVKSKLKIMKIKRLITLYGSEHFLKFMYDLNEFSKNKIPSYISLIQHYIHGHIFLLRFEHE